VVKNGVLVGVQALEEIDARPTRMLTEGLLSRLYDASRINYPMVRKSYLANYGADTRPELRGKEPFVRVSWDEAISLAADTILDTIEAHGNEAIFSTSYGGWSHAGVLRPQVLQGRLFGLIGGHSVTIGDYSIGASVVSLPHSIGGMEVFAAQTAWKVVAEKTEVMILIGCDPWNNNRIEYGVADHQMLPRWEKFKQAGVRFISINPQYTATDEAMKAEWVKIIPNTDTALFLAMSYHVYTNVLHDQAYLDKYTVGLDRFLAYLLGKNAGDAPAKTPMWAAQITGIPAQKIIELAELCASKRTQLAGAWSLQRADHGEMSHWAIINFAAMLGKIGKPGERSAQLIRVQHGREWRHQPVDRSLYLAWTGTCLPGRKTILQRRQQLHVAPAKHQRTHCRDECKNRDGNLSRPVVVRVRPLRRHRLSGNDYSRAQRHLIGRRLQ